MAKIEFRRIVVTVMIHDGKKTFWIDLPCWDKAIVTVNLCITFLPSMVDYIQVAIHRNMEEFFW